MKTRFKSAALSCALLALASGSNADEQNGQAIAEANRCDACHDVSATLLGPSYEAIAARHASQKAMMVEVLAQKIIVGGAGNWGVVPMVPNEHVSLEDARAIARWILDLN